MKTRFQIRREKKGKGFDPLVIEEFDWDNEWVDSSYVQPQGARGCDCGEDENGLTWELVDQAVGASSSLRGRNLPRNANKRARVSHSRFDFEEDFDSPNEEEEGQDQHDDVDVTDSEDAHDDVGGENTEAAPDEFEDGY
jgi:hypothetical protein